MVYEATSTLNQDDDILMFVKDSADSVEFGSIQLEKPPWANQPEIILELMNKKTSWNEHDFSACFVNETHFPGLTWAKSSGTALFFRKVSVWNFGISAAIFDFRLIYEVLTISAP